MDSRVKVTKDGRIFMYIPSECVEIMRGYQYDLFCFPQDKPVSIDEYELTSLIEVEDEEVFVEVGNMTDIHINRIKMFPTLERVKSYVDEHGVLPWGISAIARQYGWKRLSENGVSLCIQDTFGRKLKFYRRDRRAEIV